MNQVQKARELKSGDILFTFNTSFLGSLKKFIFRKSFNGIHIYLDLGSSESSSKNMVITSTAGRLHLVHLSQFLKDHKQFTNVNAGVKPRIMRFVLQNLGSKTNVQKVIFKYLGVGDRHGKTKVDLIYKDLTNGYGDQSI